MIWIPAKIEEQARLIANAPQLAAFAVIAGGLGAQVGRGHAQRTGGTGASGAGPPDRGQAAGLMSLLDPPVGAIGRLSIPPRLVLVLGGFTLLTALLFLALACRICHRR